MKFHDEFPSYRIEDMPKAIRDAVNEGGWLTLAGITTPCPPLSAMV